MIDSSGLEETLTAMSDVIRDMRTHGMDRRASNSNIMINGGSIGVWIATVCCAMMLGMGLIGAMAFNDQSRKMGEMNSQMNDMRDYLAAIYMQAPHLKPEPKE